MDLSALLNNAYSYAGLFLLVFASSVVLIPWTSVFVASFAAFVKSVNGLIYLSLFVLVASILGDLSVYFVTRKFSNPVEKWLKRFKWYSKNQEKIRNTLNKYSFIFIFLTRFLITGAGLVLNYISGIEKVERKKFISAVILGQIVAVLMATLTGYLFKDTWTVLLDAIQDSLITLFIFLISVFLIYQIIKFYKKRKKEIMRDLAILGEIIP